jgi:hypothetical protein
MGARKGRTVTHAVRSPVRPATRWKRVPRVKASAAHHALADSIRIAKVTS